LEPDPETSPRNQSDQIGKIFAIWAFKKNTFLGTFSPEKSDKIVFGYNFWRFFKKKQRNRQIGYISAIPAIV
jgi:hypothetical protein